MESSAGPCPLLPGELARPPSPPARPARAEEIVGAAGRLLEDAGPGALTMRGLADELGIQAPSLYKHFPNKAAVELALVVDALFAVGDVCHLAIHRPGAGSPVTGLCAAYRAHGTAHANLYRLATSGPLARDLLPDGLEEWAGNPFFVVTGDPSRAQELWSFAHGMVVLELDGRYPPGSDLEATWRSGAAAFERATLSA